MAELTSRDLHDLENYQPDLVACNKRIKGCFCLNASLIKSGGKYPSTVVCHPPDTTDTSLIQDNFYVDIRLDESLYPIVFETGGKILSWKECIPDEYWHVNDFQGGDGSLCLGVRKDVEQLQKQHSFAEFINIVLSNYFYYMSYVKKHRKEPWIGYRHGLFYALEVCQKNLLQLEDYQIDLILKFNSDKVKKTKIKLQNECPFCLACGINKKAGSCKIHRKQIGGHNKLFQKIKQLRRKKQSM